jgi:predicted permease
LLEQARRLPGVRAAALSFTIPLGRNVEESAVSSLRPFGGPPTAQAGSGVGYNVVSPGFFATLGIPLRGRDFLEADRQGSNPVVIVDERLARELWPGRDAIGQRLVLSNGEIREVVGVAGRIRFWELPSDPPSYFYLPLSQRYKPRMALQIRMAPGIDPARAVRPVRAVVRKLDPSLPIEASLLEEDVQETLAQPRLFSWLLGSFSFTAVLVTAIGLYGALAYAVSRRTREFGIRMALGARASEIVTMVLRRGLFLTLVGLALGLLTASWATDIFSDLLFGVGPTDPAVFVSVAVLLVLVGLAASSLPAYRATRVDPMTIIRHE